MKAFITRGSAGVTFVIATTRGFRLGTYKRPSTVHTPPDRQATHPKSLRRRVLGLGPASDPVARVERVALVPGEHEVDRGRDGEQPDVPDRRVVVMTRSRVALGIGATVRRPNWCRSSDRPSQDLSSCANIFAQGSSRGPPKLPQTSATIETRMPVRRLDTVRRFYPPTETHAFRPPKIDRDTVVPPLDARDRRVESGPDAADALVSIALPGRHKSYSVAHTTTRWRPGIHRCSP